MANTNRTGIYPARLDDTVYRLYQIAAANSTAVFVGDAVSAVSTGGCIPAAAGDNTIVLGTVVELFDNTLNQGVPSNCAGVPVGAWASSVSTKYLPASTAGWAMVAVARPGVRFIAVTSTILTAAAINASTALVAGAGSTVTGVSGHTLNGNDLNTGAQFIILGPVVQPNNDITLANAAWYVQFNDGLNMGVGKATGV